MEGNYYRKHPAVYEDLGWNYYGYPTVIDTQAYSGKDSSSSGQTDSIQGRKSRCSTTVKLASFCLTIILIALICGIIYLSHHRDSSIRYYISEGRMTIKQEYTTNLGNKNSEEYLAFTSKFCVQMEKTFKTKSSSYGSTYQSCDVKSLTPGSIIVTFTLYFLDTITVTDEDVINVIRDSVRVVNSNTVFGDYIVDTTKLSITTTLQVYEKDPLPDIKFNTVINDPSTTTSTTFSSTEMVTTSSTKTTEMFTTQTSSATDAPTSTQSTTVQTTSPVSTTTKLTSNPATTIKTTSTQSTSSGTTSTVSITVEETLSRITSTPTMSTTVESTSESSTAHGTTSAHLLTVESTPKISSTVESTSESSTTHETTSAHLPKVESTTTISKTVASTPESSTAHETTSTHLPTVESTPKIPNTVESTTESSTTHETTSTHLPTVESTPKIPNTVESTTESSTTHESTPAHLPTVESTLESTTKLPITVEITTTELTKVESTATIPTTTETTSEQSTSSKTTTDSLETVKITKTSSTTVSGTSFLSTTPKTTTSQLTTIENSSDAPTGDKTTLMPGDTSSALSAVQTTSDILTTRNMSTSPPAVQTTPEVLTTHSISTSPATVQTTPQVLTTHSISTSPATVNTTEVLRTTTDQVETKTTGLSPTEYSISPSTEVTVETKSATPTETSIRTTQNLFSSDKRTEHLTSTQNISTTEFSTTIILSSKGTDESPINYTTVPSSTSQSTTSNADDRLTSVPSTLSSMTESSTYVNADNNNTTSTPESSTFVNTTIYNTTSTPESSTYVNTTIYNTTSTPESSTYVNTNNYNATSPPESSTYVNTTIYNTTSTLESSTYVNTTMYNTTSTTQSSTYVDITIYNTTSTQESSTYVNTTIYNTTSTTQSSTYVNTTIYNTTSTPESSTYVKTTIYNTTSTPESSTYVNTNNYNATSPHESSTYINTTSYNTTSAPQSSTYVNTTIYNTTFMPDSSTYVNVTIYNSTSTPRLPSSDTSLNYTSLSTMNLTQTTNSYLSTADVSFPSATVFAKVDTILVCTVNVVDKWSIVTAGQELDSDISDLAVYFSNGTVSEKTTNDLTTVTFTGDNETILVTFKVQLSSVALCPSLLRLTCGIKMMDFAESVITNISIVHITAPVSNVTLDMSPTFYIGERLELTCRTKTDFEYGDVILEIQLADGSRLQEPAKRSKYLTARNTDCSVDFDWTFKSDFSLEQYMNGSTIRCMASNRLMNDAVITSRVIIVLSSDVSFVQYYVSGKPGERVNITCKTNIATSSIQNISIYKISNNTNVTITTYTNGVITDDPETTGIGRFQNGTLTVVFTSLQCSDEAQYYCTVTYGSTQITSPRFLTLQPTTTAGSTPVLLSLNVDIVEETFRYTSEHSCSGEIGYPEVNGFLSLTFTNPKTQESVIFNERVISDSMKIVDRTVSIYRYSVSLADGLTLLVKDDTKQNESCSTVHRLKFYLNVSNQWNEGQIKCEIQTEDAPVLSSVKEEKFFVIPANACEDFNETGAFFIDHEIMDHCNTYIQCQKNQPPLGSKCPNADHCAYIGKDYCDECSRAVCTEVPTTSVLTTPSSTFPTTAATKGHTYMECTSVSIFLSESANVNCNLNISTFLSLNVSKSDSTLLSVLSDGAVTIYSGYSGRLVAVFSLSSLRLDITFQSISCEDDGIYSVIMEFDEDDSYFTTFTVTLKVKPDTPKLTMHPNLIDVENLMSHVCTGDVGHPAGKLEIQIKRTGDTRFNNYHPASQKRMYSQVVANCSSIQTMNFSIDLTSDSWSNVTIRCIALNSVSLNSTAIPPSSREYTLSSVPGNYCTNETSVYYEQHPMGCPFYVWCVNGRPFGYKCPGQNLCFDVEKRQCLSK